MDIEQILQFGTDVKMLEAGQIFPSIHQQYLHNYTL